VGLTADLDVVKKQTCLPSTPAKEDESTVFQFAAWPLYQKRRFASHSYNWLYLESFLLNFINYTRVSCKTVLCNKQTYFA